MNINKILKLIRLAKTRYQNNFSLSYEDIDLIPDELFTLSTIQHLDLSINDIKYIPKDISKLKNLITIDLSSNKIENFPTELADIPNLIKISLSNNKINEIPSSISKFKNLRSLDLSYNNLKTLPIEILELEHLETLNLYNNPFNEIPECVEILKNRNTKVYITIIPKNLEECFIELDQVLSDEDKLEFKKLDKNNLFETHYSLGMWIRNNWLYSKDSKLLNIFQNNLDSDDFFFIDPDDISSEIIKKYHSYLQKN